MAMKEFLLTVCTVLAVIGAAKLTVGIVGMIFTRRNGNEKQT